MGGRQLFKDEGTLRKPGARAGPAAPHSTGGKGAAGDRTGTGTYGCVLTHDLQPASACECTHAHMYKLYDCTCAYVQIVWVRMRICTRWLARLGDQQLSAIMIITW